MSNYGRYLGFALLLAVLFRTTPVFAQVPPTQHSFYITGVVLGDGTNRPVARCHLTMRPEGQSHDHRRAAPAPDVFTAETDAQGRFSFTLPAEGHWRLSASAPGFRTQLYNEHEGFSSAVVVHTNLLLPTLVVHLQPNSSISGFVHDEAAEPVRNATVMLQAAVAQPGSAGSRQRATTDDRGRYEITGISPGIYKVSVQAKPWYASGSTGRPGGADGEARLHDPVFDVVYPVTWYPGVLDSDEAGEVDLQRGQADRIDFSLLPIPAAHLRVAASSGGLAVPDLLPIVERVENGSFVGVATQLTNPGGQVDFGSLVPGLYRVSTPQRNGRSTTAFVHVAPGATMSLTGLDTAGTAEVTLQVAGEEISSRLQIILSDVNSGTVFTSFPGGQFGLRRRFQQGVSSGSDPTDPDRVLAVPQGRYQVTLAADTDLYLRSLAIAGKALPGRIVTLSGGPALLTLNVARGRASVTGRAILGGNPVEGAMVMLVPTTFGQPGAIDLLRRDETNTDGSYELPDVIPGDYILLAVDHGWDINWRDSATLNRYLVHGTPLSLQPHEHVEQAIPVSLR